MKASAANRSPGRPLAVVGVVLALLVGKRVAIAYAYLHRSAPILLVFGRYVPGLRFVINTTMGLSERPYREFIPWSALGGALWSTYTCVLAYWVGSKLDDYPMPGRQVEAPRGSARSVHSG